MASRQGLLELVEGVTKIRFLGVPSETPRDAEVRLKPHLTHVVVQQRENIIVDPIILLKFKETVATKRERLGRGARTIITKQLRAHPRQGTERFI